MKPSLSTRPAGNACASASRSSFDGGRFGIRKSTARAASTPVPSRPPAARRAPRKGVAPAHRAGPTRCVPGRYLRPCSSSTRAWACWRRFLRPPPSPPTSANSPISADSADSAHPGVDRPSPRNLAGNSRGRAGRVPTGRSHHRRHHPWMRAAGPMQFLPGTWAVYGAGGNPHNINDATLAAGRLRR